MSGVPTQPGSQNVVNLALARLPEQWKNKPLVTGLLTALVSPLQDIENALQQMLTLRDISTAFGAQLDQIGDWVVQPRNGLIDSVYQRYLYAKITANFSSGTSEQLITISKLILNDAVLLISVLTQGIAAVVVRVTGADVPSTTTADALISFLKLGTKAGVRVILEYENAPDAGTFYFPRSAFAPTLLNSGIHTIPVTSTVGFPATGQLTINYGLSDAEVITYTGNDPTNFYLGAGATVHTHPVGASLILTPGVGLGFGNSSNSAIGGAFASAVD
jgi:Protein of unknown function (DUF2612)